MQRKRRKTKNLVIIFALIIACLYVGYSLITSNLQVRTSLDVAKASFDVHFENLVVNKESTTNTLPSLSEDKTTISFNITLNSPGDSYIINADIYNSGTIDAAIGELNINGLDETSREYIETAILYSLDNKSLAKDDVIKAGESENIVLKVLYKYDSEKTDSILLNNPLNLDLTLDIEYIKPDKNRLENGEYNIRPFNAYRYLLNNSVLDNGKSKYVTSANGIDFSSPSSDTNGKGIYTLSSTANDAFPINYYRGDVYDNYVIFNNYCWKIVRTTDTGGVKLILSDIPDNGYCGMSSLTNNFMSKYNSSSNDNAFVGYKYGASESGSYEATHANTNESGILYNLNIFFKNGNHNLQLYCENENYANSNYISLFNTDLLEESTFCNDRSIADDITEIDSIAMNNLGYGSNNTVYSGYKRLTKTFNPSLNCTNNNDKFTNYYGLLTIDEAMLGGLLTSVGSSNNYLYFGYGSYYLMTPTYFKDNIAFTSYIEENSTTNSASISSCNTDSTLVMRPVISLNNDVKFYKGDGSPFNPFVVYNSATYEKYSPLV